MRIDNPSISGSLSFIGGNNSISATSVNLTGSFSGSVVGTFEGGFSSAATTEISGAFDSVSSSLASELLKNTTDTLTGDLTVTGTLTAQDLHVQEVTSSILFSSGSNILGNNTSDIQTIYGKVGIGTTSPVEVLHVSGSGRFNGSKIEVGHGQAHAENFIQIGHQRTGNGYAYIDLVGDETYSDYGLRIIRNNAGPNTVSSITHRGVGNFQLQTTEAANILLRTGTTTRMTISGSNGYIGIASTSPEEMLDVSGSILINNNEFYKVEKTDGTNFKIAGLTDGNVIQVGAIDYTSGATVFAGGDSVSITTGGASGTTRMYISGSGNVGFGTTSPEFKLHVVEQTPYGGIKISGNNAPGITLEDDSDNAYSRIVSQNGGELRISADVTNAQSGFIGFRTAGDIERARLDVQGNLQIATTALSGSGDPRVTVGSKGNYYHGSGTGLGDLHIGDGNYGLSIGAALGGSGAGDVRVWTTGGTHKLYLGTNSGDRVSINSAGNVGIGTTDGSALLHLRSATPYIYLDDTSTTGTRTRFQLTVGDVGSTQTGTFSFNNTAGTSLLDVMTINENGNVGVGTTAAATKFHSYTSATSPAIIAQGDSGNEQIVIKRYSNANEQLILGFHSSDYGRIQAIEQGVAYRPLALNQDGGSVGIGTISPVSRFEVRESLNSTNFTGITVTNSEGGGSNLSRAGIAFKAYDWVQSAIWHGRNMSDGNEGSLVLGTNPNTTDLTVGGVVGRMWIVNDGNVGIGQKAPSAKFQVRVPGLGSTDGNSSTGVIFEGDRHDLMINQHRTGNTSDWNSTTVRLQNRVDSTLMSSIDFVSDSSFNRHIDINTASNSFNTRFTHNGRVGIATTNPNATLHVNGGVHFGPDSGVLNPSTGQVLIETASGGTPTLQFYPYGSSVMFLKSDGTTGVLGWSSGADREINILNEGAGTISVGIGTGAPSSTLHVFGNLSTNPLTFEGNSSSNAWVRFKAGSTASTWQIGATSGAFQFYDELNTATRLVIDSSGNVGIGTTSPIAPLTVKTTGGIDTGITLTDGNSHRGKIYYDGSQSLNIAGTSGPGGSDTATITFLTGAGTQSQRMVITRDGNVGIGTNNPGATLDHRGSYYNGADNTNSDTFIASGNYSSGTWYDVTTTSDLGTNGIYILQMYVDDFGAGGGTYFCWFASVPFNWVTTGTNRVTAFNFPALLGTGHATGTIPTFRITQELGTSGGQSKIQFNPNNNWTGINNTSGKSFRVYIKRIAG